MIPLKKCLDCNLTTRTTGSRCGPCQRNKDRHRNKTRTQYQGAWKRQSAKARLAQPWCSVCGRRDNLTLDHENNRVECRSCNSSHRRDA